MAQQWGRSIGFQGVGIIFCTFPALEFYVTHPWDHERNILETLFEEQGNSPKLSLMMPPHTPPNRRESIHGG